MAADREVIVISDDESEGGEEAPPRSQRLSWPDVVEKLLLLAKHRELRADPRDTAALLQDLGIQMPADTTHCVRVACERLGDLLTFTRAHKRRHRASEDLVFVLCEVLSLIQAGPGGAQQTLVKKEEDENTIAAVISELEQLMEKWRRMLVDCDSITERAFSDTLARLERLGDMCTQEIVRLQNTKGEYEMEMEAAADSWMEVMDCCRRELERTCATSTEREWRIFDMTFSLAGDARAKFEESKKSRNYLARQTQEIELRRGFYEAALTLSHTLTQLIESSGHEKCHKVLPAEQLNMLGHDMLVNMERFCEGLRVLMATSENSAGLAREVSAVKNFNVGHCQELVIFTKNFESFWLVHRSWLPEVVVDLVTKRFAALTESFGREACPISTAVARVVANLKPGLSLR
ncbi:unnamed protein product [Phytophthora fragariaefolia]|uniref:Unnamed protein product n=1 Tax=Phytophthora fragariaefolia TaxID=1490495 RepID=A0A9W6U2C4_9STRA|nr:unnamed protein product [Phytophthora fragariaefolia]